MGDNIMSYNGGACVAMTGRGCVAIAADTRFGVQNQTLASDFQRTFRVHDRLWFGLSGLATDVQTFHQRVDYRANMYSLREEKEIRPRVFASLVSNMLYEKRFGPFFCEPVIAGLGDWDVHPDRTRGPYRSDKPFIAGMDLLGALLFAEYFVVSGTCAEALFGTCESMYKPDLGPDELFEVISQALLNSVDRDAYSGWGATVHIITMDGVTTRSLKGRQD